MDEIEKTEIGPGNSFGIGPIVVEPGRNILSYGSNVHALEPKIMDVLEYLAIHQGHVCSRDDIIAAVWKVEYGADESLTRAISVIRKTFRQAGGKGRYIQTISKRGYSLQEPVSKLNEFKTKPATLVDSPLVYPPVVESSLAREKDIAIAVLNDRADSKTSKMPGKLARQRMPKAKILGLLLAFIMVTVAAGLAWQRPQTSETFGSELAISPYGRSVAVMPFVDLSADKGHQYFSDGIAEELVNELGKINTLRIVGQRLGGAADYNNMSYKEVGDKLGVSHIIHGSVRKQDNKVRITAQLINTADNSHAWSSSYNGILDDVFELQQRVASDIVFELSLVLSLNISEPIELEVGLPTTFAPDPK